MLGDSTFLAALELAVARLLRPLVRMLLRHSFPYSAFEAIAKRVYVEAAMKDFPVPGKKPSISRASILTGLTRKDVQGLVADPAPEPDGGAAHYNRAARVLTAWVREPEFRAAEGGPRALPMDGERGFAALVRRHGGDVPVRAVLDELLRVGAVLHRDDGCVELRQRAFVPRTSAVQKLGILGTDVGELIETIDHNIEHGTAQPRYQRKVMHVGIPVDVLPAFREMSAAESQALLERLDSWLTARDIEHVSDPEESRDISTAQVGVGIYYFEQLSETQ